MSSKHTDGLIQWAFRIVFYGVPTAFLYAGWVFSGWFLRSHPGIDSIYRLGVFIIIISCMTIAFQIVALLTVHLPRMRRRKRFWASKRTFGSTSGG